MAHERGSVVQCAMASTPFPWVPVLVAAGAATLAGVLLARRAQAAATTDLLDAWGTGGALGGLDFGIPTDSQGDSTVTPADTTMNLVSTGAVTGSNFAGQIMRSMDYPRERAIDNAMAAGNFPSLLGQLAPVQTSANGHTGVFYVTPDYIGVGTNEDWLRTPMYPATAQRIADRVHAVLPTRHMVDLIYQQAGMKLPFHEFVPERDHGPARDTTARYVQHQGLIEADRAGRAGLAAGHKKDIVVGNLLATNPNSVQIYGAWRANGTRVQPPSGGAHSRGYVDYSHGVRLVAPVMSVDGQAMAVTDVLTNPDLAALLSDEGVIRQSGLKYGTSY